MENERLTGCTNCTLTDESLVIKKFSYGILLKEKYALEAENKILLADISTIKKTILTVVRNLGMLNPDDTIKEKIDKKKLFGNVFDLVMGGGEKLQKDFSALGDLVPLIERYKTLQ